MNLIKTITLAALAIISAQTIEPAMAQHYPGDGHGHGNNNGYNNGYNNNHRKEVRKQVRKEQRRQARKFANWNEERGYYGQRWGSVPLNDQRRYDAQMRREWQAYKGANWRGTSSWNNYNDPAFLDYMHNRNPSLMTQLRTTLGF